MLQYFGALLLGSLYLYNVIRHLVWKIATENNKKISASAYMRILIFVPILCWICTVLRVRPNEQQDWWFYKVIVSVVQCVSLKCVVNPINNSDSIFKSSTVLTVSVDPTKTNVHISTGIFITLHEYYSFGTNWKYPSMLSSNDYCVL